MINFRVDNIEEYVVQLKEKGIETTIGTWHMPMTSYFRIRYKHRTGDFPVADQVFERSLTLPLYEKLTRDNQDFVIDRLLSEEI